MKYDKSSRELCKTYIRSLHLLPGQVLRVADVIAWFKSNYPDIKENTVQIQISLLAVNAPSRLHHRIDPGGSDDLLFKLDSATYRLYDASTDPPPIRSRTPQDLMAADDSLATPVELLAPEENGASPGLTEGTEFAYERDLKNYLVKNLPMIETGLRLYEEDGIRGVEYPAGGRFIDILAIDSSNNYVIVELKVSRGYDRTIGQLLRYMAWIKHNLANSGQDVRGVIIASDVSEDLALAASQVRNVSLFEYSLSMTLKSVSAVTAAFLTEKERPSTI